VYGGERLLIRPRSSKAIIHLIACLLGDSGECLSRGHAHDDDGLFWPRPGDMLRSNGGLPMVSLEDDTVSRDAVWLVLGSQEVFRNRCGLDLKTAYRTPDFATNVRPFGIDGSDFPKALNLGVGLGPAEPAGDPACYDFPDRDTEVLLRAHVDVVVALSAVSLSEGAGTSPVEFMVSPPAGWLNHPETEQ